jgi:hypothetical protein
MFRPDEHYPRVDVNPWSPEIFVHKKHIVSTGSRRVSYARVVIGVGLFERETTVSTLVRHGEM